MFKTGWCLDDTHEGCVVSVSWYDKTWTCECDCHTLNSDTTERKQGGQENLNNEADNPHNAGSTKRSSKTRHKRL